MKTILTPSEAAEHLSITERALRRLRSSGHGPPFFRTAKGLRSPVRYRRVDIDRWIEGRLHASTSAESVAR